MKKVLKKLLLQKRRKDRFKKDSITDGQRPIERSDQSIITTEEVININPRTYQCNKKKNHCKLYIWKHETGIKINFDLWKP